MKKTYTTPAAVVSGNAVRQTLGITGAVPESQDGYLTAAGTLGFHL